jgi:hypothetical protein
MADPRLTNGELGIILTNLTQKVEEGFEGVHCRQDTTNGKVIANTKFRIETEAQFRVWKWLVGFIGISNVALILKILI